MLQSMGSQRVGHDWGTELNPMPTTNLKGIGECSINMCSEIEHKCYVPLKKLSIQKHKSFTGLHFLRYLVNHLKEWEKVISGELDTSEWYLTSYFSKKDVVERHQYCLESRIGKLLTEKEERDPSFLIFESGRHKCATPPPHHKTKFIDANFFSPKAIL